MILFGIIDTKGAESVLEYDATEEAMKAFETGQLDDQILKRLHTLELRARFNAHRHPVIYACSINQEDGETAQNVLRTDPILAARILISNSDHFGLHLSSNWEELQKLRPEFKGKREGERFTIKQLCEKD